MTSSVRPIPRGPQTAAPTAAVVPGRLLALSLTKGRAVEDLAGWSDRIEPLRKAGWQIEWLAADAAPARWADRMAHRRNDAGSQLMAQEAYAAARAAFERSRRKQPPQCVFRRLEERLLLAKHPPEGTTQGPWSALRSLLARFAFRVVRPLRKLQERRLRTRSAPPIPPRPPSLPPRTGDGTLDLGQTLAGCGPYDMVLLLAAEPRQLEWLLQLPPAIGLDRPINSTLHVLFAPTDVHAVQKGEVDLETLAQRWRTGSPFRNVCFHAGDAAAADFRRRQTGFEVGVAAPLTTAAEASTPPSLVVERYGPVALQITALWGRTGSTSIFDSQARYLVQRGFMVARIFVEHWPHQGEDRIRRIDGMVAENFESVRPHAWTVVERDETKAHRDRLLADPDFAGGTTLRRMALIFAEPAFPDRDYVAWLARNARLSLVNHLPHVLFAARLTRAPLVFETHDIYTKLLATHGVPQFVPENPAPTAVQLAEEAAIFAKAAACVNLSEDDQGVVAPHTRFARVIRPYARSRSLVRRSWPEVVAVNNLDASFLSANRFDLMLWGDWHGGNVAGVKWFVEEVMPLCPRLAEARILLVGRVSRGLPPGLAERARFLVAGFVDRLDDFIVRTKVLLIPDQGGSGISIKAMDAFAFGRPFVSTSAGMRCVDVGDTGYTATDDPTAFGAEIVRLLDCRAERERRATTARRLYELNFSREAYADGWDAVLAAAAPDALRAATAAVPSRPNSTDDVTATQTMTTLLAEGDQPMRISIIICTYDRYDVLPDAIASAQAQDLPAGHFEVIVVDNSPDQANAAQWAADYAGEPHVRYHCEPVPGLSNARNVGTELARSPIVAFMDDDAIASPRWAAELLDAYEAYPVAGIVGGLVTPKWVGDQGAPWLHEDNIGYLSIVDWGKERRPLAANEWVAGTNISFRRDVLLAVGGFSRSLGRVGSGASLLSNEETAVAEKIHEIGRISVYAPAAAMQHVIDPKRLSRDWFRKRAAWQAVSDFIKDPKRCNQYAPQAVKHLQWALDGGHRKVPFGTFHRTDDKSVFKDDMGVMYDLVIALLAGGFEVGDPT